MKRNTFEILGIKLDSLTISDALNRLEYFLNKKVPSIITTPNTEFLIKAQKDDAFKNILNRRSLLNLPDSYGLLWAARFLTLPTPTTPVVREVTIFLEWLFSLLLLPLISKSFHYPIKEKISGSDFIWHIARFAAEKKVRLFLFGGEPTVAEQAALHLQTDVYGLRITGMFPGDIKRSEEAIAAIKKSKAEILLVCLGAPLQEKWLVNNLARTGCKVGIGLGGTFDFVSQKTPRAPLWMQLSGLEWLYRLIVEPRRAMRQFALPKMACLVLLQKLQNKDLTKKTRTEEL